MKKILFLMAFFTTYIIANDLNGKNANLFEADIVPKDPNHNTNTFKITDIISQNKHQNTDAYKAINQEYTNSSDNLIYNTNSDHNKFQKILPLKNVWIK